MVPDKLLGMHHHVADESDRQGVGTVGEGRDIQDLFPPDVFQNLRPGCRGCAQEQEVQKDAGQGLQRIFGYYRCKSSDKFGTFAFYRKQCAEKVAPPKYAEP